MKNDMTNHTFSYYRIPFYAFIDFYNGKTVRIGYSPLAIIK
jgi:hypothetical protein